MTSQTLELKRSSAASGPNPGVRQADTVAKLIDTSTCIGCKACEVACQEWNDLAPEFTTQVGTYQTLPDMAPQYWNLIRFNELQQNDKPLWLMRKDQCMHCADPGCLAACPAPGAIVQYANGIVDFQQDQCIGCGYCITGCPFNVPKISAKTKKVYKCTLCVDRVTQGLEPACIKACPTGCLQFGSKTQMVDVANKRVKQLKENGFEHAMVYDPQGVGGTGVVTVLAHGDKLAEYTLPENPTVPMSVTIWKSPLKWVGNIGIVGGLLIAALHYLKFGPKDHSSESKGDAK